MANKRLNAVVTIGGAVAGSLKSAAKGVKGQLGDISKSIRETQKRQALLSKSIDTFGRQGKDVSRMREEYARLGAEVERLRRRQDALKRFQDADLSGSFGRMRQQVGGLVRRAALLGTAAAGGIFALAKSTADAGNAAVDHAEKLGIHVERLQELRYAGERAGVSTQNFDLALQRMTRRVSDAARGNGPAVKALDELGLSAAALASMTPDEMLNHVADAMADVENQSDRVRLAFALFDSGGVGLVNMLADGSAGLRQLSEEARATGNVLNELAIRDAKAFGDQLTDMTWTVRGLKNTLGAELMPVVTQVMGRFSGYLRENRGEVERFAVQFAGVVERAVPAMTQLAESGVKFVTVVASITAAVAGMVGGFDNLATIAAVAFSAKAIGSVVMFGVSVVKAGGALLSLAGALPAVAGGIKAIGLALMANPIGLIIGGIAAAGFLIYKYWEPIKGFVTRLWDGITDKLSGAWEIAKTIFGWSPMGLMMRGWGAAFEWLSGKFEWLGNAWRSVRGWFGITGDTAESSAPQPGASSPAPEINAPAIRGAGGEGQRVDVGGINIVQQPGEDPEALAERVWQTIQRKMQEQQRGALYDAAGAY